MKRLTGRILPLCVAVLLFSAGLARADLTNWNYSWSIAPNAVITPSNPGATGSVLFALEPSGVGAAVIRAAEVTTNSSAAEDTPDVFGDVGYTLTLTLTDDADGESGSLDFGGLINGNLTSTGSSLVNTFTEPLTQTLVLPTHTFEVTVDPSQATLPAPGSAVSTLLDAFVTVTHTEPGGGGNNPAPPLPPVAGVPEPASLFLGSLGFSALGLGAWWKRKRRGSPAEGRA